MTVPCGLAARAELKFVHFHFLAITECLWPLAKHRASYCTWKSEKSIKMDKTELGSREHLILMFSRAMLHSVGCSSTDLCIYMDNGMRIRADSNCPYFRDSQPLERGQERQVGSNGTSTEHRRELVLRKQKELSRWDECCKKNCLPFLKRDLEFI